MKRALGAAWIAGSVACVGSGPSDDAPHLRVRDDKVMSRSNGFDAELVMPRLDGIEDGKLARGTTAWLQRGVRRLMGSTRAQAEARPAGAASTWTVRSTWRVPHDGARYLSVVQDVVVSKGAGPGETTRFAATLRHEDVRPVFLPDLLDGDGIAAVESAVGGAADGLAIDPPIVSRFRTYHLTDEALVLSFEGPSGTPQEVAVPFAALADGWAAGASPVGGDR